MKTFNRIMEVFWLLLTLVTLAVVIYLLLISKNIKNDLIYLLFPFLTGLMYTFRRALRKKIEKNEQ